MTVDTSKEAVERLAAPLEADCMKHKHGECRTRSCLVNGGWDGKTLPIDTSCALCKEAEIAATLRALSAEKERLREALTGLNGAIDDFWNDRERIGKHWFIHESNITAQQQKAKSALSSTGEDGR